jgi:glycosyltransferase involved in cell wall biosynthesis
VRIAIDARIAQSNRVGIGVYVLGLVRAVARQYPEHELALITSPRLPDLDIPTTANLRIVPEAPTYQEYIARDWWEQVVLPDLLGHLEADVYHSPNYTLPFLRRSPCPMVLTLFDASLFVMPSAYRARHAVRVRLLIRRSVGRADAVVFGSEHAREEFRRLFGDVLPRVQRPILMGVPEDITGQAGAGAGMVASVTARHGVVAPYVIAVGSIHPRKNYERLIAALARPELSQCRLVICGGVGWKAGGVRRALEETGVGGRVKLTGYVTTPELRALIEGAEMMVFPSLYEGFGIPPLEAFAVGVPVCASRASSVPEVVGDAAVMFDPRSVEDMAGAMARVLGDQTLREELIRRGRARLRHFSWERCAREHMGLYTTVAARRARSRR